MLIFKWFCKYMNIIIIKTIAVVVCRCQSVGPIYSVICDNLLPCSVLDDIDSLQPLFCIKNKEWF